MLVNFIVMISRFRSWNRFDCTNCVIFKFLLDNEIEHNFISFTTKSSSNPFLTTRAEKVIYLQEKPFSVWENENT